MTHTLAKKAATSTWPNISFIESRQRWQVDARTAGGGSRRFFATKIEAQTFAQQCRLQKKNSGISAFGNEELAAYGKTVGDAVAHYLAYLRQREKSVAVAVAVAELIEIKRAGGKTECYCNDIRRRLERFCLKYGERIVASITSKELDSWLAELPLAPGTKNTFRRDLRTFFSFCTRRGYCAADPAIHTERAETVDAPPGILTTSQCAAFLAASGNDVLPYVAIGLFGGLRTAELKMLDWAEIDLVGGHIEVTAAKSKTRKRRLVPISTNLAAWLQPLARTSGPVAPAGIRKRFGAVKIRAGIEQWPPNALRHSYGSYRLAFCADAARVSLEMGNSPEMIFQHYREIVKPKDAARYWEIMPNS